MAEREKPQGEARAVGVLGELDQEFFKAADFEILHQMGDMGLARGGHVNVPLAEQSPRTRRSRWRWRKGARSRAGIAFRRPDSALAC